MKYLLNDFQKTKTLPCFRDCNFTKTQLFLNKVPIYPCKCTSSIKIMNSNELCIFQKELSYNWSSVRTAACSTDVSNHLVFHVYHSWCRLTLHVLLTLQWLQASSPLQRHVRMYYPNDLVYFHPLLSAGAIEWRHF